MSLLLELVPFFAIFFWGGGLSFGLSFPRMCRVRWRENLCFDSKVLLAFPRALRVRKKEKKTLVFFEACAAYPCFFRWVLCSFCCRLCRVRQRDKPISCGGFLWLVLPSGKQAKEGQACESTRRDSSKWGCKCCELLEPPNCKLELMCSLLRLMKWTCS